ncbi:MAG: hypothetical protein HQK52_01300 [Oligoflexia bacterium]|nr:hypothetical protein [Oligoflexia bacterium]
MTYKRSIYLINPKFQLRLALFVSSLVMILGLVYPLTIYELFSSLVTQTKMNDPLALTSVHEGKISLILSLIGYHAAFVLAVFIVCIIQGHRIAGPMFNLKRALAEICKGNPIKKIQFRKNDHFVDVADDLNTVFNYIQNSREKDLSLLNEVIPDLKSIFNTLSNDKQTILSDAINKLSTIKNRFEQPPQEQEQEQEQKNKQE